jgi:hypothetical protein
MMLISLSDPDENEGKSLFPPELKMIFSYQEGVKSDFFIGLPEGTCPLG